MAPLAPRSVIGILGSGQLGRMLSMAASRLGFRTHVYGDDTGPAFDVSSQHSIGPYDDLARLDEFARQVDVVTYEFENVPLVAAEHLARLVPVRPGARALAISQDRIVEKTFIRDLGIDVAPFAVIRSKDDLAQASTWLAGQSGSAILKTARLGYDGKGQANVGFADEVRAAFSALGSVDCVLEQRLPFEFELSVLVVRGLDGRSSAYDIPRNEHRGGILRLSTVPAGLPAELEQRAISMATRIADALDYVGVLAVEMFVVGRGEDARLIVNEIAPRVHNSGHWTMDACAIGQFENHIRAVAGWPVADTGRHSDAVMQNLIGREVDGWPEISATAGACLHLYGKRDAREGRKMGHVNHLKPRSAT